MFSFFVTVLVLIQVIATSVGQSVPDERNQQVMVIHQVLVENVAKFNLYLLCLLTI